jgi:hypothetical protein
LNPILSQNPLSTLFKPTHSLFATTKQNKNINAEILEEEEEEASFGTLSFDQQSKTLCGGILNSATTFHMVTQSEH